VLAVLLPESSPVRQPEAQPGGWSWFGDPENWLGAPRGHEPVDQVEEARQRELCVARARRETAVPQAQSPGPATQQARSGVVARRGARAPCVPFVAEQVCLRHCWKPARTSTPQVN